jgi:hypothetical protein
MDALPFVDDHTLQIEAPLDSVWRALLRTARASFAITLPKPILALWGLEETKRAGAWDASVAVGDTLLGFHVDACSPGQLLALRGRHRFSRYELRFELEPMGGADVTIHAKAFAVFPGWAGRLYRALVIGTGGHSVVVRRMLRSVARRASRESPLRHR